MAGPQDYFMPDPRNMPPDEQGLGSQLMGAMQDPRIQGALMQAGLNLMGGRSWGDTGASQVARAIGGAGEQGARVEAADIKQRETGVKESEATSKQDLRGAQADAATARSGQAATMAELARGKLDISRERLDMDRGRYEAAAALNQTKWNDQIELARQKLSLAQTDQERKQAQLDLNDVVAKSRIEQDKIRTDYLGRRTDLAGVTEEGKATRANLAARVRLSNMYQQYRKDLEKPDPFRTGPAPTPLSMDDWVRQNPMLKQLGLVPDTGDTTAAPSEPATSAPGAVPPPAQRVTGQTYQTPKGPLKWTGTGWVNP